MDIGQFIKTRRLELKYSQRQIALNSGLSNATISRIESGAVIPDAATLSKMAKALKVSPSLLFNICGYISEPEASNIRPKTPKPLRGFGARLNELRESAGYSQEEFSEAAGYRPEDINDWEEGIIKPDNSVIHELADFFGVAESYLLGRSDIKYAGPTKRVQTPERKTALRETEEQDIRAVLKELSKAVENAQKVLAMYADDERNNNPD